MEAAVLTPPSNAPAHILAEAIYDFDMFDDRALRADPHARVLDLVENAPPIFRTPREGGHVVGPETLHILWDA